MGILNGNISVLNKIMPKEEEFEDYEEKTVKIYWKVKKYIEKLTSYEVGFSEKDKAVYKY